MSEWRPWGRHIFFACVHNAHWNGAPAVCQMQKLIKQKNSLFNAFVPNDATAGGGDDELSTFNNDDAVYMFNNSVIYIFFHSQWAMTRTAIISHHCHRTRSRTILSAAHSTLCVWYVAVGIECNKCLICCGASFCECPNTLCVYSWICRRRTQEPFFFCCCCCFTSASHTVMALSASSNIEMTVMSCILNAFLLHHSCAIHESVWLFFVGSGIIHLELCIMRQSLRVCVWGVNVFHCSMYVVWHEAKNADNHDNKKQTSSNQQLGASFSLLLGT